MQNELENIAPAGASHVKPRARVGKPAISTDAPATKGSTRSAKTNPKGTSLSDDDNTAGEAAAGAGTKTNPKRATASNGKTADELDTGAAAKQSAANKKKAAADKKKAAAAKKKVAAANAATAAAATAAAAAATVTSPTRKTSMEEVPDDDMTHRSPSPRADVVMEEVDVDEIDWAEQVSNRERTSRTAHRA